MKKDFFYSTGVLLMKIKPIKVCIIDDVKTYFNEQMLSVASSKGNMTFERYQKCDTILLKSLVSNPRDILIVDIKGTPTLEVGKDGFDIVRHVTQNTSTFIATTSAHKYHLKSKENFGDYIIAERILTPVDFTEEMNSMINNYLKIKTRFYQKIIYKVGLYFLKHGLN